MLNDHNAHIDQIARTRELATFVNRFLDEVSNTLCAPWERTSAGHRPCESMKRALKDVKDDDCSASDKVLKARMTLGADNSIYLQSGMSLLWSGEMANDMQYKMFPSAAETGEFQHTAVASMLKGLEQQVANGAAMHDHALRHMDNVLSYLLCIDPILKFVDTVLKDNMCKQPIEESIYSEWLEHVPADDRSDLAVHLPKFDGIDLNDRHRHALKHLTDKRMRGGDCMVATMASIVLSLLSDTVTTVPWRSKYDKTEYSPSSLIRICVENMAKIEENTENALMEFAIENKDNLKAHFGEIRGFRYASTFWPDDGAVGSDQAEDLKNYTAVQALTMTLERTKFDNQKNILDALKRMVTERRVFEDGKVTNYVLNDDSISAIQDVQISNLPTLTQAALKRTSHTPTQEANAIAGCKVTSNAGSSYTKEAMYPNENPDALMFVNAAINFRCVTIAGPHQKTKQDEYNPIHFCNSDATLAEIENIRLRRNQYGEAMDALNRNAENQMMSWTTKLKSDNDSTFITDKSNKYDYTQIVEWTPVTLSRPQQVGTKSLTPTAVNVCKAAIYQFIAKTDAFSTDGHTKVLHNFAMKAVAKLFQVAPLAVIRTMCRGYEKTAVANEMNGEGPFAPKAEDLVLLTTDDDQNPFFIHGIVSRTQARNFNSFNGSLSNENGVHVKVSLDDAKNNEYPEWNAPPQNITYPSWLTPEVITDILRIGLGAHSARGLSKSELKTVQSLRSSLQETQSRNGRANLGNVVIDSDERARRGAVWEDALRELAVSGDRMYGFLRTMAGCLHEDVQDILNLEDRSMEQAQRNIREQRKEIAKNVSAFGQRLVDSLLTSLFKETKLKVDLSSDPADAAGALAGGLVVLSDENMEQIRELASGQSGLPYFQQRVDLDRVLRQNTGKPMPLSQLVRQIATVMDEYKKAAIDALDDNGSDGVHASLEYLSSPKNSFVIRLKNEAYAAIHIAFDRLCTEASYNNIKLDEFTAWECIEGEDRMLRDQFAQLCAYSMSHARVFSSRDSAYVTRDAQRTNAVMLNVSLQKTIYRLQEYIRSRRGGVQPKGYLRKMATCP